MNARFDRIAARITAATGSSWAFLLAFLTVVVWAASGPFLGFSDVWQLTINTGTTIVTFLTVFLIQNAQNRGTKAMAVQLDEILRAIGDARNDFIGLEDASADELDQRKQSVVQTAEQETV